VISTHVLDTSTGRPAGAVPVSLELHDANGWQQVTSASTDVDGRVKEMWPSGRPPEAGVYRLTFATGAWFTRQGIHAFHPQVSVEFLVTDATQHHHIPLLLSPFGFTTYKGS
jgi:5-hydroxyisourate hydrolase